MQTLPPHILALLQQAQQQQQQQQQPPGPYNMPGMPPAGMPGPPPPMMNTPPPNGNPQQYQQLLYHLVSTVRWISRLLDSQTAITARSSGGVTAEIMMFSDHDVDVTMLKKRAIRMLNFMLIVFFDTRCPCCK
jgi:hypothetical protein